MPFVFRPLYDRVVQLPTFRALGHRNYCLFFVGRFISLTGTALQMAALMWLAYDLTGDAGWPAWVLVAHLLPSVVLGPWGGVIADRWPRRPLLVITQSLLFLESLTLAALVFWLEPALWQLLLLASASGAVLAVDLPARLAYLIELVGRQDLGNAVALNSLLFNVTQAIGPALAGLLLSRMDPSTCFFLNAISYGAVIVALLLMDSPWSRDPATLGSPTTTMSACFRFVLGRRRLLLLFVLTAFIALCGWPVRSLFPDLCSRILNGGPIEYGWMLSAMGAGALVAAFVVATFASFETTADGKPSRAVFFLAKGVAWVAASLLVLALSTNLLLSIVACFGVGYGMISFQASSQAVTQLRATELNRGVVMGIWAMIVRGAQLLGFILAGWAAHLWSVPIVLLWQTGTVVFVALLVFALEAFLASSRVTVESVDEPSSAEIPN